MVKNGGILYFVELNVGGKEKDIELQWNSVTECNGI